MSDQHATRPEFVVNGQLIRELMAASTPCAAVGSGEARGAACAFFAVRPGRSIRPSQARTAFRYGYALLGAHTSEVLHFGFTFFEVTTYHVLVNPNNPIVRSMFDIMLERRSFFVFMITSEQGITAFRADLSAEHVAKLTQVRRRTRRSATTAAEYGELLAQFRRRPDPPGEVLDWVCADKVGYLDLTRDRLNVSPDHRSL